MVPAVTKNAGEQLEAFCTDSVAEYVYLGPLQDWLKLQYPDQKFPVLQALAELGKVFAPLSKNARKTKGGTHDTVPACDYLRLHCFRGKIVPRTTCHASEEGIDTFLKTIFNGSTDAAEAIKFINNNNMTMLVTRRTYNNPSNFTDALSHCSRGPVATNPWCILVGPQYLMASLNCPPR